MSGSDSSGEHPARTPVRQQRDGGLKACRRFQQIRAEMGDLLQEEFSEERLNRWIATVTDASPPEADLERAVVGLAHARPPRAGLALERFEPAGSIPERIEWLAEVALLEWRRRSKSSADPE